MFRCEKCKSKFSNIGVLKKHIRKVHEVRARLLSQCFVRHIVLGNSFLHLPQLKTEFIASCFFICASIFQEVANSFSHVSQ